MTKKAIILIIISLFIPVFSFAQQINLPFALSNELNVEINPKYPRPNEKTTIMLSLYSDNLNTANIAWYQDNKIVDSGIGKTSYTFTTGNVGQETLIEIQIKLLNGTSFSRRISLTPVSVDLVWEADSYVPPFYKGKALNSRQGFYKIVAMPEFYKNGRKIPAENLVYNWMNGLKAIQNQSGYGRYVVYIDSSFFGRNESIELIVTDPVNDLVASQSIEIVPTNPQIIFYERHPYYGYLFDNAMQNQFELKSDEVEIVASPYFFAREDVANMKFGWRINNNSISSISDSRSAIFRRPENSGRSVVSLRLENQNRILQQAQKSLTINFE